MMRIDLSKVRNIGIAAHIDAGKTTTTERILYYTGKTHRMGEVDEGTTTTDFEEEEQKRGITIYSAAVTCPWRGHTINLIDTPGHVDFTAEVERSLRVLDGMVAVFDAKEGVEAQTETVWRQADKYGVPRICFINKLDRLGSDFERCVASILDRLQGRPLVVQIPLGEGSALKGLVDLIEMKAIYYKPEKLGSSFETTDIPPELMGKARHHRHTLIESLADMSESIMEHYLEESPIGPDEIRSVIREATLRRAGVPVLCGSALRYIGVQRMLDAVCDYLPSPLEAPPVLAMDAKKEGVEHELPCDPSGPLAALVFKVVAEKPVDLHYLRVYSGTLKPNMRLWNPVARKKENLTRIYRMFAKRREQTDRACAGEIVAVVGPKCSLTGHTLCEARNPMILESIDFPETVISVSVEPKSSKDRDRLSEALIALERQDPTLTVTQNAETGQTLLSGMGELHLEIMVQRLKTEKNVDVSVGKPRVSYRETVRSKGEGEGRFARQIGGRAHFAVVRLHIEPWRHEKGRLPYGIENAYSAEAEGAGARHFDETFRAGIMEAAQSGPLGGYPVIDWKVKILDPELDDTDSSQLAVENAARIAFYEAMKAARPVLLEPIMDVEVVTADEYFGSIMADLNARRAVVRETRIRGSDRIISAAVPLAQMFGYITKLRSLSQGRATSSMTPSHYAPVGEEEMKLLVGV